MFKQGVVSDNLTVSFTKALIPDNVALQLSEALSYQLNIYEDVQEGDRFAVVYETALIGGLIPMPSALPQLTAQNQNAPSNHAVAGQLLAFEYVSKDKSIKAYWYRDDNAITHSADSTGMFYTADGAALKPSFLRAPIETVRVTSGFGVRKRPKRKASRNHEGIDFAAPVGTKIFASGDGEVILRERQKLFGNIIKIRHSTDVTTVYAHMSDFGEFVVGDKVRQGQIIGFVGRTGVATGPHLHYEFRVNGKALDPFEAVISTQGKIADVDWQDFTARNAALDKRMAFFLRGE